MDRGKMWVETQKNKSKLCLKIPKWKLWIISCQGRRNLGRNGAERNGADCSTQMMKLTHKEDVAAAGLSLSGKGEEAQINYTHLQLRDTDQVSKMPTDFCIMSSPLSPHRFHAHHLTPSLLFPFHLPPLNENPKDNFCYPFFSSP